jgi:hypothetical protein
MRTDRSQFKDARVHCVVLKVRAVPTPQPAHGWKTKAGPEVPATIFMVPGPSGPNSVHAPTRSTQIVPPAASYDVLNPDISDESLVKCSTHELPAETFVLIWRLDTPKRVPDAP